MLELSETQIGKIEKKLDFFKKLGFTETVYEERGFRHWRKELWNGNLKINWNYYLHYSGRITDSFTFYLIEPTERKNNEYTELLAYDIKSFDKFIKRYF